MYLCYWTMILKYIYIFKVFFIMFSLYLALFKNNQHQLRDIINSTAKKRINLINQVL